MTKFQANHYFSNSFIKGFHLFVRGLLIATALLAASTLAVKASPAASPIFAPPPTPDCNASPAPEVNWDDCEINKIIKSNLNNANLYDSWMRRTDLSGLSLSGARLMRVDFSGADLSHTVLNNADLTDAILSGANLSGTSLTGAVLRSTSIPGGFIFDASTNLNNVDLSGADLSGADLTGINLSGVNLTGANLTGVNLTNAITSNRTNFSGADLTGVIGLVPSMKGTFDNVTCPNGTVIGVGQTCFTPTAITLRAGSASLAPVPLHWIGLAGLLAFWSAAWIFLRLKNQG